MKSHSCLEVRGAVVGVFTASNCDYVPSKVMPYMEPMGRFVGNRETRLSRPSFRSRGQHFEEVMPKTRFTLLGRCDLRILYALRAGFASTAGGAPTESSFHHNFVKSCPRELLHRARIRVGARTPSWKQISHVLQNIRGCENYITIVALL
jgi:hypothetical protein